MIYLKEEIFIAQPMQSLSLSPSLAWVCSILHSLYSTLYSTLYSLLYSTLLYSPVSLLILLPCLGQPKLNLATYQYLIHILPISHPYLTHISPISHPYPNHILTISLPYLNHVLTIS